MPRPSLVIAGWGVLSASMAAVLFTMPGTDDFAGAPLALLVVQLPALWALSSTTRAHAIGKTPRARLALSVSGACVVALAVAHGGYAAGTVVWSEPSMLELRPILLGAAVGGLALFVATIAIDRVLAQALGTAKVLAVVTLLGLASCTLAVVSGAPLVIVAATVAWTIPLWALLLLATP